MPFGRKSLDPSTSKISNVGHRPITAPALTNALPPRNLSIGPPSSALSSKASVQRPKKRPPSVSSDEDFVEEVVEVAKRARVEQKQADAIASPDGRKRCAECKTTETSTWRRDTLGNLICNKCGLRKRKDIKGAGRRSAPRAKVFQPPSATKQNTDVAQEVAQDLSVLASAAAKPMNDPRPPRPWANAVRRSPVKLENPAPSTTSAQSSDDTQSTQASKQRTSTGTQIIRMTMPVATAPVVQAESSTSSPSKSLTPSRRPGPKKAVNPRTLTPKVCLACGIDESPAWRKDKDGNALCNKCMLRQKRAEQRKPGQTTRKRRSPMVPDLSPQSSTADGLGVMQQVSRGPQSVAAAIDHTPGSRHAARTDSQAAYDTFTHINSQPSSFVDEHDSSQARHFPVYRGEGSVDDHNTLSRTKDSHLAAWPNTTTSPSVISRNSFYGSSTSEKSTAMVSRADARAASRSRFPTSRTSEDEAADSQLSQDIYRTAPGWPTRGDDSPQSESSPVVKHQKRPHSIMSDNGSVESNDSRLKAQKSSYREGGPCARCGTVKTPLWRRNSQGQDICNKCGIQERREKDRRSSAKRVVTKVSSRGPTGPSPLVLRTHAKTNSDASSKDMVDVGNSNAAIILPEEKEKPLVSPGIEAQPLAASAQQHTRHSEVVNDHPTQKSRDFWSSLFTPTGPTKPS